MERPPTFLDYKTQNSEKGHPIKSNLQILCNSNNNSVKFFIETGEIIKLMQKHKRLQTAKTILNIKNTIGSTTIHDFK